MHLKRGFNNLDLIIELLNVKIRCIRMDVKILHHPVIFQNSFFLPSFPANPQRLTLEGYYMYPHHIKLIPTMFQYFVFFSWRKFSNSNDPYVGFQFYYNFFSKRIFTY